MAKKSKAKKARNPNDATFRNITAVKARLTRLEDAVSDLARRLDAVDQVPVTPLIETEAPDA